MHIYIDVFVCVYILASPKQRFAAVCIVSSLHLQQDSLSTKAKSVTDQQNMGIKPRIGEFLPDPTPTRFFHISQSHHRQKQINDHTHIYI
jgi:hypothetical protein